MAEPALLNVVAAVDLPERLMLCTLSRALYEGAIRRGLRERLEFVQFAKLCGESMKENKVLQGLWVFWVKNRHVRAPARLVAPQWLALDDLALDDLRKAIEYKWRWKKWRSAAIRGDICATCGHWGETDECVRLDDWVPCNPDGLVPPKNVTVIQDVGSPRQVLFALRRFYPLDPEFWLCYAYVDATEQRVIARRHFLQLSPDRRCAVYNFLLPETLNLLKKYPESKTALEMARVVGH